VFRARAGGAKTQRVSIPVSNYQVEYSRNLVFEIGGHMDQVFQALIDRSRVPLDLETIKTILGYQAPRSVSDRHRQATEAAGAVWRPRRRPSFLRACCEI
jgi:hypothetical protein